MAGGGGILAGRAQHEREAVWVPHRQIWGASVEATPRLQSTFLSTLLVIIGPLSQASRPYGTEGGFLLWTTRIPFCFQAALLEFRKYEPHCQGTAAVE